MSLTSIVGQAKFTKPNKSQHGFTANPSDQSFRDRHPLMYIHGALYCVWYEARVCLVHPLECELCGAYAVAVGVVALCLLRCACARAICVDVVKQRIAVCTYAWARFGYEVYNSEHRVGGVQGKLVM